MSFFGRIKAIFAPEPEPLLDVIKSYRPCGGPTVEEVVGTYQKLQAERFVSTCKAGGRHLFTRDPRDAPAHQLSIEWSGVAPWTARCRCGDWCKSASTSEACRHEYREHLCKLMHATAA